MDEHLAEGANARDRPAVAAPRRGLAPQAGRYGPPT
jgi:hypothetical protein